MFKENPYGVHGTVTIAKVDDKDIQAAVKAKLEFLCKDQNFDTSGAIQIDNVTVVGNNLQVDFEVV